MDDIPETVEQEIQRKGLTAPRVSQADLEANIADVEIVKHVTVRGKVLRWAVITTQSGFAVTGKPSAAVSPANDDAELGVAIATKNAKDELWALMGYALSERLSNDGKTRADFAIGLREFVGFLSGDVPELGSVSVPRLGEAVSRFLIARNGDAIAERHENGDGR